MTEQQQRGFFNFMKKETLEFHIVSGIQTFSAMTHGISLWCLPFLLVIFEIFPHFGKLD